MKNILHLLIVLSLFSSFNSKAQVVDLPMKGSYIYYEFNHTEKNTKKCLKKYTDVTVNGQINTSAAELQQNVPKRAADLNDLKFSLSGLKTTGVGFVVASTLIDDSSCEGEFSLPNGFNLMLSVKAEFLPSSVITELFTVGKFKVYEKFLTATVKVKFTGDNSYTLIFTNFKIKYQGRKGANLMHTEVVSLEDVYKKLKENGKQKDKMYAKGQETIKELDAIVKACARIYEEELRRVYEIDQL